MFLISWAISVVLNALALVTVAELFGSISIDNFQTALLAGLVLSILNVLVKPLLIILTFPITILSLGLFLFVINAGVLMLTANFLDGFTIDSFSIAILASILISIITMILNKMVRTVR